ncbi:MAG: ABC transporter permease [Solirubrobacterales bacterium]|nr:ABC transporter permease [Solirubrobacterales bacterium]
MRRRSRGGLQGLLRVGPGLDGDQGLSATAQAPRRSVGRRSADLLHGRRRTQVGLLLAGPLGWLVVAYLGSLAVLFVAAFWQLDTFTGQIVHEYSFSNFQTLWENDVYRQIVLRTVGIAAAVTVTDAIIAFPIAFYMAKVASPRARAALAVAVLMPLWASYLVKVYAWRTILAEDGILNWLLDPFGISRPGKGVIATWLVFSYLWLPYMILPIYAGLERIPNSLVDASGDLGGRPGMTFRRVILPLAFPAVVAGSIFTFSLTLGDYITPQLVSSKQFIGNVVYANVGVANNLPLAAAFATVPVVVMVLYLLVARRLGAFEQL